MKVGVISISISVNESPNEELANKLQEIASQGQILWENVQIDIGHAMYSLINYVLVVPFDETKPGAKDFVFHVQQVGVHPQYGLQIFDLDQIDSNIKINAYQTVRIYPIKNVNVRIGTEELSTSKTYFVPFVAYN